MVGDAVWYSLEREAGKHLPNFVELLKAPVADFTKRLNVFQRAHRVVCWGHSLSPRDLAGEVEYHALNGHAVALGPDSLSPLWESSVKTTYLVHGFRDSACSGWLLGDCGSAAVDHSQTVMETVALCYGSWKQKDTDKGKYLETRRIFPGHAQQGPSSSYFFRMPLYASIQERCPDGSKPSSFTCLSVIRSTSERIKFQYLNILGDIFNSERITVVIEDMKIP